MREVAGIYTRKFMENSGPEYRKTQHLVTKKINKKKSKKSGIFN